MWLAEVCAKAKRHNQILFSKENALLDNLRHLIGRANRRALILWLWNWDWTIAEMPLNIV